MHSQDISELLVPISSAHMCKWNDHVSFRALNLTLTPKDVMIDQKFLTAPCPSKQHSHVPGDLPRVIVEASSTARLYAGSLDSTPQVLYMQIVA